MREKDNVIATRNVMLSPSKREPLEWSHISSELLIVTPGQPSPHDDQTDRVTLPHEGNNVTMAQQPEKHTDTS
jgi:hypothetical protein